MWECITPPNYPYRLIPIERYKQMPTQHQLDDSLLTMVFGRNIACVQALIGFEANVNAYTNTGIGGYANGPPIITAISQRNFAMIELLLKKGADVTFRANSNGKTPLEVATIY